MLEKITTLLKTGTENNIELAHQLSISSQTSLWPLERGIKDLLFMAHTQPKIHFDNMPLGELCYILKEVIALSINNASVETIPEQLYFMPNLRVLEIIDTPIKKLPSSLCELKMLKSLIVRNTAIDSLPEKFQQLTALEKLSLLDNPNLKSLPSIITKMKPLKKIRISKGFDLTAFEGLDLEIEMI